MTDDIKKPLETTRRTFIAGSAAAVSTFFIGRPKALAGDAEITLKLATVAPSGTPWSKHIHRIKKRVKEETDGRVKIKPYLGGALGDEIATLQRCQQGSVHMWAGSLGAFEKFAPELCAFELPYLFPSARASDDIIDNKVWGHIERILKKAGFKLMFASENGERSIGTNFGFVKSTGDLRGKRLRAQQSFHMTETLGAMGATAEPIPVTDVMTALQTGVVDGFDNTPLFTFAASWYQAITHFTLTRHILQPAIAVMHLDTWKKLDSSLKSMVEGDAKAESAYGRKKVRALKKQLIKNFDVAGIGVHESTSSERAAFKKATAPVHKKWTDKYGSTLYKAITKHL